MISSWSNFLSNLVLNQSTNESIIADGEAREHYINAWQGLSTTNTDASLWKVENKGKMLVLGCRQDTIDTIIILVRDYFWASNENEAYIRIDWLEQKFPFVMT